jgi:hypothetical protein
MCFTLAWFEHFIVTCIIVGGAILLLKLLVGFVAPKIGMGGEVLAFVVQAFMIVLWCIVCIALVVFVFGLVSCLLGGGFALPGLR